MSLRVTSTYRTFLLFRVARHAMHRVGASPRTIQTALSLFLLRRMLCWQLALFASVFPNRRRYFVCYRFHLFTYALLTTALWVSRIRRKALKYTAGTGWGNPRCHCAGCTPLCAGRCARRLFVLLVVLFVLSWLFFLFQRPRDFGEINKTRTSTSSRRCTAYHTCVALLWKKTRAREIRCTLQGCCLRRIQLCICQGTLHCAVFRFVRFSAIKT